MRLSSQFISMALLLSTFAALSALLSVLVGYSLARRCRWFTALIIFYIVRSVLLVAVPTALSIPRVAALLPHSDPAKASGLLTRAAQSFAAADTLLQLGVLIDALAALLPLLAWWRPGLRIRVLPTALAAIAIAVFATIRIGGWPVAAQNAALQSNANVLMMALFVEAALLTFLVSCETGRSQTGRSQTARSETARASVAIIILRGFGLYSFIGAAAMPLQSAALQSRVYGMFIALAYLKILAYLAAIVFWILGARRVARDRDRPTPSTCPA